MQTGHAPEPVCPFSFANGDLMKPQHILPRISAFCLLTSLTALPAVAQTPVYTFSSEFSVGVGMDSNVGISDLDQNTGEEDLSLLLGLKLDGEAKATERLKFRGGYELSQTSYSDDDQFSLQLHRGSLEAIYDLDVVEAGLLYTGVHARLDGEGYLNFQQISPYVSRLIDDKVFLRGALEFSEKDFDAADARDADGQALRGDAYFFLNGTRNYISVGGKLTEEDAIADEFSFSGQQANIRYTRKADLLDRQARFQIGAGWENRDYEGIPAALTDTRADEILSVNSGLEFELVGPLSLDVDYRYQDRSSNLESADYDEHVGEMRLVAKF